MMSEKRTDEIGSKLHDVIAVMLGRDLRDGELPFSEKICPFDIERENLHENKSAFNAEYNFVQNWLVQCDVMTDALVRDTATTPHQEDMNDLVEYLNGWARSNSKHLEPETPLELAINNVMRVGIVPCILMLNDELKGLLRDRLKKLDEQEAHYWNIKHRPPNYYARTIALRLAQLFARETGEYPTIGTSPDSDAPSTAYGRALEETFRILSIEQNFRGPGEWAISQISERDTNPRNSVDPLNILRQMAAKEYLKK